MKTSLPPTCWCRSSRWGAVSTYALLATVLFPVPTTVPAVVRHAPVPAVAQSGATLSAASRQQIFTIVWSSVNKNYYDPTFGGVNWKAVRTRYAPLVARPQSDSEFYTLMSKMLGELKHSHIGIFPPEAYAPDEATPATADAILGGPGTTGLTIQWVEEKPIITQVVPGSGGAVAGLRPGYIITAVNGKAVQAVLDRLRKRSLGPDNFATKVLFGFEGLLAGSENSMVAINYLDADDKPQTAQVKRTALPGVPVQFGELPTMYVQSDKKLLDGNIGYIRFNIFLMPILTDFRSAIASLHGARGIILDLRGNPGGIGVLAPAVAREFFTKATDPVGLGTMKQRNGENRFPIYPGEHPFTGRLVLLTDEGSASTSEVLAGGLQDRKRATIVGGRTAGAVLPSIFTKLPGGARLQLATADYKTPKGTLLEGRGVFPDVPVTLTRKSLLTGRDAALDAAVAFLNRPTDSTISTKTGAPK